MADPTFSDSSAYPSRRRAREAANSSATAVEDRALSLQQSARQNPSTPEEPSKKKKSGKGKKRNRPPSFGQVIGEILITLGLISMLFVGYQLYGTNVIADQAQKEAAQGFAKDLQAPTQVTPEKDWGPPPPTELNPSIGQIFGLVFIPRFGGDNPENYAPRPLIQGTRPAQLDTYGLGHYPDTALPGEKGNFAIAGHRQTKGAVLDYIDTLVPGDKIYIQTKQGYYTYEYRNTEIVLPSQGDVLLPVPMQKDATPGDAIFTMTSCNPRFGNAERIIAYSVLSSWQPLEAGPPAEIAKQVAEINQG